MSTSSENKNTLEQAMKNLNISVGVGDIESLDQLTLLDWEKDEDVITVIDQCPNLRRLYLAEFPCIPHYPDHVVQGYRNITETLPTNKAVSPTLLKTIVFGCRNLEVLSICVGDEQAANFLLFKPHWVPSSFILNVHVTKQVCLDVILRNNFEHKRIYTSGFKPVFPDSARGVKKLFVEGEFSFSGLRSLENLETLYIDKLLFDEYNIDEMESLEGFGMKSFHDRSINGADSLSKSRKLRHLYLNVRNLVYLSSETTKTVQTFGFLDGCPTFKEIDAVFYLIPSFRYLDLTNLEELPGDVLQIVSRYMENKEGHLTLYAKHLEIDPDCLTFLPGKLKVVLSGGN